MRKLLRYADTFFGYVSTFFPKAPTKKPGKIKKIVVAKLWGMGDAVLTIPLLVNLKNAGYDLEILCTKRVADVYKLFNFKIKPVSPFNILKYWLFGIDCDLFIDLEQEINATGLIGRKVFSLGFNNKWKKAKKYHDVLINFSPNRHMVFNYLNFLEFFGINGKIVFPKICENKEVKKRIYLNPVHGGTAKIREWHPEKWLRLAKELSKMEYEIYFSPFVSDELRKGLKKYGKEAPKTSLSEFAKFLCSCEIIVTIDTGILHLASALNKKIVGLFGPQTPKRYGPLSENSITIYKSLKCSPCILDYAKKIPTKCMLTNSKYGKCMDEISVKEVLDAIIMLAEK